jgi:hypothetical protein
LGRTRHRRRLGDLLVAGTVGAFEKLKSLAGEWTGKMPDGMAATSTFRVTADALPPVRKK